MCYLYFIVNDWNYACNDIFFNFEVIFLLVLIWISCERRVFMLASFTVSLKEILTHFLLVLLHRSNFHFIFDSVKGCGFAHNLDWTVGCLNIFYYFNEHNQDLNPGYLDLNLTALAFSYLPFLVTVEFGVFSFVLLRSKFFVLYVNPTILFRC